MPIKKSDYPNDWPAITQKAKERAGKRCVMCFVPDRALIVRCKEEQYPWRYPSEDEIKSGIKLTKIILTTHHIDGNKDNNCRLNLISLCQKDHLRLDMMKHVRNRKARRGGYQEALGL